jgi:hypothetical protein
MTSKRFRRDVFLVVAYLAVYAAAAAWSKICGYTKTYDLLHDFLALGLALPAAFLAGMFQRRNNYLIALRDYWKQLIPAVQAALQYTHETTPTQAKYAPVYVQLSSVVDVTRSVFANVPTGRASGLYPFENLKDILAIIRWLGFDTTFRSDHAAAARQCITKLWQEMFLALLREFDRDVPVQPVTKYYFDEQKSLADYLISESLRANQLVPGVAASHPPVPDASTASVFTRNEINEAAS